MSFKGFLSCLPDSDDVQGRLRRGELLDDEKGLVFSREQFLLLERAWSVKLYEEESDRNKQLVWLNSKKYGGLFGLNPQCRMRGRISGTSCIPPKKAKEELVPVLDLEKAG